VQLENNSQEVTELLTKPTENVLKESLKEQVRQYFDDIAPQIDRWRDRNHYYYQDLESLHRFLIPPGSRVLEIGCGTGDLLAATKPAVGVGIDFAPAILQIARSKYPQLQFYCLDAETITPADLRSVATTFDFIILSGGLSHLSNIQLVLQNLQLFCHRRTRVILSFHNFLWQPVLRLAERLGLRRPQPLQSWLSMHDVQNLLLITGYTPIKLGRRFLVPKYVPWLSDVINRYIGPLPGISHLCLTNYVVARPQMAAIADAMDQFTCSVIIPARNEAGNIQRAIDRMPKLGKHTEIIFVEGHSQDDTWATIQRVIQQQHSDFTLKAFQQLGKGKADAVQLGFAQATGDILLILDADLTVQPEDLPYFVDVIAKGRGELINGSRMVYPRSAVAMPWLNMLANKFFSLAFSFLLGQPLKDTLCGTKVLWRQDYERIAAERHYFGNFDPFGDFDLLFGAAKLNLQIVEVPVRYQPREYGVSNISHIREGFVLLGMCLYASRKIKFF